MKGVIVAIWLAWAGAAGAQSFPALHDVAGVAAGDVLNLRAEADAGAAQIGSLPPDAKGVEVVALSQDGKWGRVNLGEASGWAAMRYLVRAPGPDWDSLAVPMTCSGTEPFWSLDYAPERRNMMFSQMGEDTALGLWVDWHLPVEGRLGDVGWSLQGPARSGFATLVAQACSDGMSDRAFGIAMHLFLKPAPNSSAAPVAVSGCCSLAR